MQAFTIYDVLTSFFIPRLSEFMSFCLVELVVIDIVRWKTKFELIYNQYIYILVFLGDLLY